MFRLIGLTLATIILGFNTAQAAEQKWFEVEVYIFSHPSTTSEKWPDAAIPADTRKAIDLITPAVSTNITGISSALSGCTAADWATKPDWCNQQLQETRKTHPSVLPVTIASAHKRYASRGDQAVLLADSQSRFKHMINRISQEPGVQGLLHMTWQERMQPKRTALPIRLYGGKDFADEFEPTGEPIQANDNLIKHLNVLNHYLDQNQQAHVWQLDGTLNIYLSHWLYIETDLVLRKEGEKEQPKPEPQVLVNGATTGITEMADTTEKVPFLYAIHMKQNRRVRSNETHYFDHPDFGMLIQIRKMPQP